MFFLYSSFGHILTQYSYFFFLSIFKCDMLFPTYYSMQFLFVLHPRVIDIHLLKNLAGTKCLPWKYMYLWFDAYRTTGMHTFIT